jgi:protocatechuate 3,4-dioxygenase beta subunit
MMKDEQTSRRNFIHLCIGGTLVAASYPVVKVISQPAETNGDQKITPTPNNTLGPFYKKGAPRREKIVEANDAGKPLFVSGRVVNVEGKSLANAKVEVFHANNSGDYDMGGWNWRGEVPVNGAGEYRFESIVPGQYGGRAQHIHYRISAPGHKQLITQLYFANDPFYAGDPDKNYKRDGLVWHRELIRPVTMQNKNNTAYSSVVFDICLEKA